MFEHSGALFALKKNEFIAEIVRVYSATASMINILLLSSVVTRDASKFCLGNITVGIC